MSRMILRHHLLTTTFPNYHLFLVFLFYFCIVFFCIVFFCFMLIFCSFKLLLLLLTVKSIYVYHFSSDIANVSCVSNYHLILSILGISVSSRSGPETVQKLHHEQQQPSCPFSKVSNYKQKSNSFKCDKSYNQLLYSTVYDYDLQTDL